MSRIRRYGYKPCQEVQEADVQMYSELYGVVLKALGDVAIDVHPPRLAHLLRWPSMDRGQYASTAIRLYGWVAWLLAYYEQEHQLTYTQRLVNADTKSPSYHAEVFHRTIRIEAMYTELHVTMLTWLIKTMHMESKNPAL